MALTAFLDTNVLVRHLTGDPPEMAARATKALAGGELLLLADLVRGIERMATVSRIEP